VTRGGRESTPHRSSSSIVSAPSRNRVDLAAKFARIARIGGAVKGGGVAEQLR
jgi:hypothetical protein